jgi:hypothetical protein
VNKFVKSSQVEVKESVSRSNSKCSDLKSVESNSLSSKAARPSVSTNLMAPPATPNIKQMSNSFGGDRLHKRTLSNSLLDLNSSGGSGSNSGPMFSYSNTHSKTAGIKQFTLQRTGSQCSLTTNNTKLSMSSIETPQSTNQFSSYKTPIKKADSLYKFTPSATTSTLNSTSSTTDHRKKASSVQCRLSENEKITKKLSMSAQVTCQNSLRHTQRHKVSLKKIDSRCEDFCDPNKIEAISLEEKLRKKKVFANDDYEYINYFGTPNVRNLKLNERNAFE